VMNLYSNENEKVLKEKSILPISRATNTLRRLVSSVRGSTGRDGEELEKQVHELAGVLVNMVIIGKEKRTSCTYYDVVKGVCRYIKMEVEMPTMTMVKDGNVYRIAVLLHPEVCAVCPFWNRRQ